VRRFLLNISKALGAGASVASAILLLPLESELRVPGLVGATIGGLVGVLGLVIKAPHQTPVEGPAAMRVMLSAQMTTFTLRLLAVGIGAAAFKFDGDFSPVAYVAGFFCVYLIQQFAEMRSLLAGAQAVAKKEVTP
jgi:hypothetical protein